MQVLITNRQRRVKIDMTQVRLMVLKLSAAIFANLIATPIAQFSPQKIERLGQRATLSLVFLSNEGIRKINKDWRGKDSQTDVLSFALALDEPPAEIPWQLGEIFISLEKAVEQAQANNHSLRRELAFLFVHGMLHIFGFDHESRQEEELMFGRQKIILEQAGYPRLNL